MFKVFAWDRFEVGVIQPQKKRVILWSSNKVFREPYSHIWFARKWKKEKRMGCKRGGKKEEKRNKISLFGIGRN